MTAQTTKPDFCLTPEQLEQAAYVLRAIANCTRLNIISTLGEHEEMNVSQLIESIGCEQSLLSHHLTDMRAKGILNYRKEGKNAYYSLANKHITQIITCIKTCHCTK